MFNNKSILVTGGTGSFGKHFVAKILKNFSPKKIFIVEMNRNNFL